MASKIPSWVVGVAGAVIAIVATITSSTLLYQTRGDIAGVRSEIAGKRGTVERLWSSHRQADQRATAADMFLAQALAPGAGRTFLLEQAAYQMRGAVLSMWVASGEDVADKTPETIAKAETNKKINPRKVVLFHEGRGSQEGIFAELKTHCQMGYVPVKTRVGNQLYMFAGILAHNLTRELQMRLNPREGRTTAKRAALWCFREVETLRRTLIQRAGRIIRPAGKLILSMNSNARLEGELRHALAALNAGA